MLRLALTLISSLQIGARIKSAVQQSVKKAVLYAIAGVILLFAIGFGLIAGHQAEADGEQQDHAGDGIKDCLLHRLLNGTFDARADLQGRDQRERETEHGGPSSLAPGEDAEQEA